MRLVSVLTAHAHPWHMAQSAMLSCMDGSPSIYDENFIQDILNATTADVAKLMRERLEPFFHASGNAQIVVFAQSKVEEITRDFQEMGYVVEEMNADAFIGFEGESMDLPPT